MRTDRWLAEHAQGADPAEALAYFDGLEPVEPGQMLGRWRGSDLPTGSPLDGLLGAYGWYGKEFVDAETVHPLLVTTGAGPRPVDPALIPVGVLRDRPWLARSRPVRAAFSAVRPLLTTTRPAARLRRVEHRGTLTAALLYDRLPITDVFRLVSTDVRLGVMDLRGLPEPFFFVLRRES